MGMKKGTGTAKEMRWLVPFLSFKRIRQTWSSFIWVLHEAVLVLRNSMSASALPRRYDSHRFCFISLLFVISSCN